MKEFFRLLLTNFITAIIIITVAACYFAPLIYVIVINDMMRDYKKVIFAFVWFVAWAILSITAVQYLGKNEQN